ncbi:cupin [Leptolyngbya sp. AN03gr2]|uniref:cysteine dioxygenase family protein n=1 Tax=unclassified Leptolyngbya TaxID=2650499 RepID=UPI003D31004F
MTGQNWFVTDEGQCQAWQVDQAEELIQPYRLYRFLTELEDVLNRITDDQLRLQAICPLVRQLLMSSSWLQLPLLEPDPETGWAVSMLYDEPFFPLTVQLVAWSPGITSPVHNHASWGLVALLSGQEKNTFWQRSPTPELLDRIKPVEEQILVPGDILCLMPETIHHIEAIDNEPTISFNLYGETNYDRRFEFDPIQGTAKNF